MTNHPTCATCAHYEKPNEKGKHPVFRHVGLCAKIPCETEMTRLADDKYVLELKAEFEGFMAVVSNCHFLSTRPDFYCPLHSELERNKTP